MHNQNEFAPLVLYSKDSEVKCQHLNILATQFGCFQTKNRCFKVLENDSYTNMGLVFSNVSYMKLIIVNNPTKIYSHLSPMLFIFYMSAFLRDLTGYAPSNLLYESQ